MTNDSISTTTFREEGQKSTSHSAPSSRQGHQLTPHEVLSWLPAGATPEQQDSMIQAHIKPSPVAWSHEPDTLHLPGQDKGESIYNISLPKYYKESFFSNDSLFHPELPGGRQGVAGDPVPYTVASDNLLTGLLIACFCFALIAFANSRNFIMRQIHNFFRTSQIGATTEITETFTEVRFQFFLVLQTCLMTALTYFFWSQTVFGDTYTISTYGVIGLYTLAMVGYFLLKGGAYALVDWVFFEQKKNTEWNRVFLFLCAMEGVCLFPMIMLLAYFDLSISAAVVYTSAVVILFKILAFYKTYMIFFEKRGAFLQIILYFCALEIMPLIALWGVLMTMSNYLKISF